MNEVDYSKAVVPDDYKCGTCGATDVKLWREYQTFSPQLLCADCAAVDQHKDISDIDAGGMRSDKFGRTDQIEFKCHNRLLIP